MLSPRQKKTLAASAAVLSFVTFVRVIDEDLKLKTLTEAIRLRGWELHRRMSINLGGGLCEWTAPIRSVPTNIDYHKTLVVGFPSR